MDRRLAEEHSPSVFPIDYEPVRTNNHATRSVTDGFSAFHLEFFPGAFARKETTGPSFRVAAIHAVCHCEIIYGEIIRGEIIHWGILHRAAVRNNCRHSIFRGLDATSPRSSLVCASTVWRAWKSPIVSRYCPRGHKAKLPVVIFLGLRIATVNG
jgi:hypothetical protein